jgi:hypothetical protein
MLPLVEPKYTVLPSALSVADVSDVPGAAFDTLYIN